jgi:hypothetical protein
LIVCPTEIKFGFNPGFATTIAATETPYFAEIRLSVSPNCTVYTVGHVPVVPVRTVVDEGLLPADGVMVGITAVATATSVADGVVTGTTGVDSPPGSGVPESNLTTTVATGAGVTSGLSRVQADSAIVASAINATAKTRFIAQPPW